MGFCDLDHIKVILSGQVGQDGNFVKFAFFVGDLFKAVGVDEVNVKG